MDVIICVSVNKELTLSWVADLPTVLARLELTLSYSLVS